MSPMLSFIFQPNCIKVDIKSRIYKSRIKVQLFSDKYNLQKYASYALFLRKPRIYSTKSRKQEDRRSKKARNQHRREEEAIHKTTEKRNPRMTAAQQAYKTRSPDQSRNECSGEMYTRLKWVWEVTWYGWQYW